MCNPASSIVLWLTMPLVWLHILICTTSSICFSNYVKTYVCSNWYQLLVASCLSTFDDMHTNTGYTCLKLVSVMLWRIHTCIHSLNRHARQAQKAQLDTTLHTDPCLRNTVITQCQTGQRMCVSVKTHFFVLQLAYINLAGNSLTGTLPSSWSNYSVSSYICCMSAWQYSSWI